jgi:protein arginine N-methyltransferase 3
MSPPRPQDAADLSDSEVATIDSDSSAGYEDAPDADIGEETPAVCLFCSATFAGAREVFAHCDREHGFDWKEAARGADFYTRIKLVNYIRTLSAAGKTYEAGDRGFEDDRFLQPVMEEDPLLFSLDEDGDEDGDGDGDAAPETAERRIRKLEENLRDLAVQFQEYKSRVSENFVKQMEAATREVEVGEKEAPRDDDSHYFNSYAGNGEY